MLFHYTQDTTHPILQNASLAVDIFFCLSGFVLAYSYSTKLKGSLSTFGFLKKRLVRLYPMYTIGLAIGLIALIAKVLSAQTNLSLNNALESAISNLFYIPYIHSFYIKIGNAKIASAIFPLNDPAWSLFFELMVNIFFALVIFFPEPLGDPLLLAVVSGLALVAYSALTHIGEGGWGASNFIGGIPRTWFGFFSGVLLYEFSDKIKNRVPNINPVLLLATTLGIFLIPTDNNMWLKTWLLSALVVVPVIVAFGSTSQTDNSQINYVAGYLGWISYPLYCVHFPIYSLFTTITNNRNYGISGVVICSLVSWGVAHYSSKLIEEPVRGWLSGK